MFDLLENTWFISGFAMKTDSRLYV